MGRFYFENEIRPIRCTAGCHGVEGFDLWDSAVILDRPNMRKAVHRAASDRGFRFRQAGRRLGALETSRESGHKG